MTTKKKLGNIVGTKKTARSLDDLKRHLKSSLSYRVLEGRIAFDAAMVATADQAIADQPDADAQPVSPAEITPHVASSDVAALADSLTSPAAPQASSGRTVVFIDSGVNDPGTIAAASPEGADIVLLDSSRDGVEQIASYLDGRSGIDAVHIVSHGGSGALHLGSSYLTLASLSGEHSDEMSIIRSALSDDADLLIYGCDVGTGESGRAFVGALAAATGADVAASSDDTGAAAYGANWDLETRLGLIEAGLIDAPEWNGVLAPFSISAATAPVVRDNTGAVVAITAHDANFNTVAVGTANSTNVHITDPAKMVGATVIWANAGFVGGTAIDLRATVLSVTDTNPNANQPVTLNFAINGDDPSVRIENAEVRIRWEAFAVGTYNPATGTGTIAQGDVGFFIRDIDALGDLYSLPGGVKTKTHDNLTGVKPQESVRADLDELDKYTTESFAATHLTVGLNIDPDTGATVTDPLSPSFGKITATNLTDTEVAESISGVKFNWNNVSAWEVTYRVAPPPGPISLDSAPFDGIADTGLTGTSHGQRFFDHDGDGDLTFVSPYTVTMRNLDLDGNNSTATGTAHQATFTEGGAAVNVVDADVDITGLDSRVVSATVTLTNTLSGDQLLVNGSAAPSGTVNGLAYTLGVNASGQITVQLTGSTTDPTVYETALQQITFNNTSDAPSNTDRQVEVSFSNGTVSSSTALATIHVTGVNDVPVATADSASQIVGSPVSISVLGNDTDIDNALDPASVQIAGTASPGASLAVSGEGTWSVNTSTGAITFTPVAGFVGIPTAISYSVADASGARSNSVSVSILPLSSAPHLDLSGQADKDGGYSYPHNGGFGFNASWSAADGRLTSVSPAAGGPGLTYTNDGSSGYVSGVASATLSEAIAQNEYISMPFTTVPAMPETWLIYNANRIAGGNYRFSFAISTDVFQSATLLSQDNAPNTGVVYDANPSYSLAQGTDYQLQAGTNYEMRVYFYAVGGGAATTFTWDDIYTLFANDPTSHEATFTEGGASVSISAASVAIEDANSATLASGNILLTNKQTDDRFVIGSTAVGNGSTGTVSGITYTVTETAGAIQIALSGSATKSAYATFINSIKFENTSQEPSVSDRTITVTVNDGVEASNVASALIHVVPVNDAPIVDLNSAASAADAVRGNAATFTENGSAVNVAIAGIADVNDFTENDITSFSITAGGVLDGANEIVAIGGASFPLNADSTQSVTIGGTTFSVAYTVAGGFAITKSGGGVMPQADLDALVRSVTYRDAGEDPAAGDRTLTFTATDAGGLTSAPAIATITVAPVNDAPVAVDNGPVSGNEDTPIIVNVLSNDTDVDDALDPTTVVITTTPPGATLSGDGKTLMVPGQGVWSVDPASGTITFTPAADYFGTPTSITYTVKDASGAVSNSAVVSVVVIAVNDPPIVDLNSTAATADTTRGNTVTYVENAAPISVAPLADVSHLGENDITSMKIAVGGILDGAAESIAIGGVTFNPTVSSSPIVTIGGTDFQIFYTSGAGGTGTFNIAQVGGGTIAEADLDLLVRNVTYADAGDAPTAGNRTLTFTAKDSSNLTSTTAVAIIALQPVNDPDTISLNGGPTVFIIDDANTTKTFTEGDTPVAVVDPTAYVNDFGENDFYTLALSLSGFTNGSAEKLTIGGATFSIGTGGSQTVTVGGTTFDLVYTPGFNLITIEKVGDTAIPVADINALMRGMTYENTSEAPTAGVRQIGFFANEFGNSTTDYAYSRITVVPVNDAPILDLNSAATAADADRANAVTFTEGDVAVSVALAAADAYDYGENDVTSVTIVAGGIQEGAFETVTVGGQQFDLSADATRPAVVGGTPVTITYVAATGTFTVTPDGGTYLPNAALDALLQGVKYENTDQSPTAGDRTLTFTATDAGGLTSAPAVATVTVVPVNDAPILDLNSAATTGDTSRDTAVVFTEGDAPVAVAAINADLNDITEADVTKLTIVASGVQDGAFEQVAIGGKVFDLSTDGTQTATIGGTTVQIAYVAATGTFTITNAAGATTPMPQADLDTLVRGITYENADQNPVAGDRTLTFTATDAGGLTSAPAVATITVVPVNDIPVVDLNGPSTPLTSLVNGGLNGPANMSTLPAGWTATNITPDTVTTNGPFNGGLPWVLSPEGGTFVRSSTGGQEAFGQQLTGLAPGATYEVTFYQTNIGLINPGSTQFTGSGFWDVRLDGISIGSSPVMDTWTGGQHPTTHNNEWRQVTLTFTATAASQFIEFRGMSPGATTAMGIDTITITPAEAVDCAKIFTEGDAPVNVAEMLLADVNDITEADVTELKIVVAGVQDGAFEKVAIGGVVFDLTADSSQTATVGGTTVKIAYVAATGTFTIVNDAGAAVPMAQADLDTLVRGITYENADQDPVAGDRTLTFTATDSGGLTSGPAVATITVVPVNDPPVGVDDAAGIGEDGVTVDGNVLTLAPGIDTEVDGGALSVTAALQGTVAITIGSEVTLAGGGKLKLNDDGSYTFTPGTAYNGLDAGEMATETIEYTVSDGNGGFDTALLVITINGANDTPVVIDPSNPGTTANPIPATDPLNIIPDVTRNDGQALTPIKVGDYIVDPDGEALTFVVGATTPSWISIDPVTGEITGTPPADSSHATNTGNPGEYLITITATDIDGTSVTTTVTLTIINLPPVAVDDVGTVLEDGPAVTGNVITDGATGDTDTAPDSDVLHVAAVDGDPSLVGAPVAGSTGGTFTLLADGSWTFDPGQDFQNLAQGETRETVITYRVSDGQGGTAEATVTVTVTGTNDAPVALGPIPAQTGVEGTAIAPFATAAAFANPTGLPLTFSATNLPEGLVIDPATGVISGTPSNDASEQGPYVVMVTTVGPNGETATIAVQIGIANPVPVAVDDHATTPVDTPVVLAPLSNDKDADGDVLTVTSVTPAANGTATLNSDGTITYVPNAGFVGTETLTYTVTDAQGQTSLATITITVGTPPADAPVVAGTIPDQVGTDGSAITPIDAGVLFSDPNGGPLAFTASGLPPGLSIDPATGVITGTLEADASVDGPYTVTVTGVDPDGNQVSTTFILGVLNPAPVASADATVTAIDTPVVIGVLGNDSDPDGDVLPVSYASDPANGTVTVNANGTITYTPDASFTGTDTFSYTVSDGEGGTSVATVTVYVGVPNPNAPVVAGPLAPATGVDGSPITPIDVGSQITDPNGDPLVFSATGLPPGLAIDPATGVIHGTLEPDASTDGPFTITVKAVDPIGNQVTTKIVLTATNPVPVAVDDTAGTAVDQPVAIGVLSNDSDPDGDVITVTGATDPANGTVVINPNGTITYTPDAGFTGTDTFIYTITDADGTTTTATVTVNVGTPSPLSSNPAIAPVTGTDGAAITPVVVGPAFGDPDALDTMILGVDPAMLPPGIVFEALTGTFSGTPENDASQGSTPGEPAGTYIVPVVATDAKGLTTTTYVTFTFTNLPPVAVDDAATSNEDTAITGNVLTDPVMGDTDTAPDSDPVKVALAVQGANTITLGVPFTTAGGGVLTLKADGSYTFSPGAAYNGMDAGDTATETITYTISDGNGGTDAAELVITITGVNDAPVVVDPLNPGTPANPNPAADPLNIIPDVTTKDNGKPPIIDVSQYIRDPEGKPLTFSATGLPPGLKIDPDTGVITGSLPKNASTGGPDKNGVYTVTITATDEGGKTVTTTITYTVKNPAPIATDDKAETRENQSVTIKPLGNDRDPDGDKLSVVVAVAGNGTVTINKDGSISYMPRPGFAGTDTIKYVVSDGEGGFTTATVTIEVEPQPPVSQATVFGLGDGFNTNEGRNGPIGTALEAGGHEPMGLDPPVVDTVNTLSYLGGIAFNDEAGYVEQVVDGANRQVSNLADGINEINGLSGFSLRSNVGSSGGSGEIVIESMVHGKTLIIKMSGAGLPEDIEWTATSATGDPLPDWLSFAGGDVLMGERAADTEEIELRFTAELPDGTVVVRYVKIQPMSGEIEPLDKTRSGWVPPQLIWDQLKAYPVLEERAIRQLARAIG